jgi:hypothetical protein
VPTIESIFDWMVVTAQVRLCPPYAGSGAQFSKNPPSTVTTLPVM